MNITHDQKKGEELLEKIDIDNSPFQVVSTDGGKSYFGVMGQYRLTEPYESKEECIKEVSEINWNRVIQVILLLNEKFNVKDFEVNEN